MPSARHPYGFLTRMCANCRASTSGGSFMLDLAFIILGAGILIALALYAAALERL
jgi:hypothetical protein